MLLVYLGILQATVPKYPYRCLSILAILPFGQIKHGVSREATFNITIGPGSLFMELFMCGVLV
jgi:hypothetical protein